VKLPSKAQSRVFLDGSESAYESIASLEPANHEFESYTRVLANSSNLKTPHLSTINSNNTISSRPLSTVKSVKSYSVDYGFDAIHSASPSISTTTAASSSLQAVSNNSDSTAQKLLRQQVKHSTLNSQAAGPTNANSTDLLLMYNENLRQIQKNDNDLYERILERLSKSSIDAPAHVPLLCICTFNLNESRWLKLISRLSALGINVRLIEIVKGVPVNALFYLSNLDLIYVRTADELEGYVPKDCCKPVSCSINISNNSSQNASINNNNNNTTGVNTTVAKSSNYVESLGSDFNFIPIQNYDSNANACRNDDRDSIKYHSLSSSEYDDLIEPGEMQSNANTAGSGNSIPSGNLNSQINYSIYKTQDSGYRSEIEIQSANLNQNQYERRNFSSNENSSCVSSNETSKNGDKSPKVLLSLPSRSRLPISMGTNMNLTLMDPVASAPATQSDGYFANNTYKSQASPLNNRMCGTPGFSNSKKSSEFQRAKSSRRSLDSSMGGQGLNGSVVANLASKFFAVPIDLNEESKSQPQHVTSQVTRSNDDKFAEIDLKRIELDSLVGDSSNNVDDSETGESNKLWTVILRHEARNFQEISVSPGMLVSIIKTFNDWIYVKLVGFENTNLDLSQQYGIIPKSCVADLNEVILNSQKNESEYNAAYYYLNKNRRKSSHQITAL
jgi:hypothetical protein